MLSKTRGAYCIVVAVFAVLVTGVSAVGHNPAVFVQAAAPAKRLRKLALTQDVNHIVIFRIIRCEKQLLFLKSERSLLLVGVAPFLDHTSQFFVTPLGLLFGLDTVALLATVLSPLDDVEFTMMVTAADRSLFSPLTAALLEAALYQPAGPYDRSYLERRIQSVIAVTDFQARFLIEL